MHDQMAATPRGRMRARLRYLYGDEPGDRAFADLMRLLDAFPARRRPDASPDIFDQTDAILITYGDTFLDPPLPRPCSPSAPSPSATSTASSPPSTSCRSSPTPPTTASR